MEIAFILIGYLSGSVLYARIVSKVFKKENMIKDSRDQNPGTANAFMHGGFWCGILTLLGDILKGLLPMAFYSAYLVRSGYPGEWNPFVIAAPVVGHIFPVFYGFRGGKGIATTFGCLLGLFPFWQPATVLAFCFIFFSVILRITPHFYRTLITYLTALLGMIYSVDRTAVISGFIIITAAVCIRLCRSREEKKKVQVKLLWMR